jgi:hypothetical protein
LAIENPYLPKACEAAVERPFELDQRSNHECGRYSADPAPKEERRCLLSIDNAELAERRRVMARRQDKSVTGTITAAFDKVIADYPLLVLHAAFILGVMLGQQTAKSRFSLTRWATNVLPEAPRVMAASLPSFARRSGSGRRKAGRSRRSSRGHAATRAARSRRQPKAAAAAE